MTDELISLDLGRYQYRAHVFEIIDSNRRNRRYTSRQDVWPYFAIINGLGATDTCRTRQAAERAACNLIDREMDQNFV
jgi:hypothetical protein